MPWSPGSDQMRPGETMTAGTRGQGIGAHHRHEILAVREARDGERGSVRGRARQPRRENAIDIRGTAIEPLSECFAGAATPTGMKLLCTLGWLDGAQLVRRQAVTRTRRRRHRRRPVVARTVQRGMIRRFRKRDAAGFVERALQTVAVEPEGELRAVERPQPEAEHAVRDAPGGTPDVRNPTADSAADAVDHPGIAVHVQLLDDQRRALSFLALAVEPRAGPRASERGVGRGNVRGGRREPHVGQQRQRAPAVHRGRGWLMHQESEREECEQQGDHGDLPWSPRICDSPRMGNASLLVEHARYLLTVDRSAPHHPGRLRSSSSVGRISRVGKAVRLAGALVDRVTTGRRFVVTPGFVNGHMHISYAHAVRGIFPDDVGSPTRLCLRAASLR